METTDNRKMKAETLAEELRIPAPPNERVARVEIRAGDETIVIEDAGAIVEVIATYARIGGPGGPGG